MIKQNEARKIALENVSFERKIELFNRVSERIKEAAEKGERRFIVSEEEELAIGKELVDKGYSKTPIYEDQKATNLAAFCVASSLILNINGNTTYFF